MNHSIEFVEEAVRSFPSLQMLLEEHRADNDEILPYVWMADLTRLIVNRFLEARSAAERDEVQRIVEFLEASYKAGPKSVTDLIALGFIENMPSTGERGNELRALLGPALEDAYGKLNW